MSVEASAPAAMQRSPTMHDADPRARGTRTITVMLVVALIVWCLAWELVIAPLGGKTLALKVLPLALLVSGLMRFRLRSYRVLSMVTWLYALEGAVRGASDRPPSSWMGWGELGLSLILFVACVAHVRHRVPKVKKVRP